MDIIITGATGGIGRCLVDCALASHTTERVYCRYRDEQKFRNLFGQHNTKIVEEKHDARCLEEGSSILNELYRNRPQSLACIYTMFTIRPIKRMGTYNIEELKDNLYTNVLDLMVFTNALLRFQQECSVQLRLINIDSGAAYKPLEGWAMYSASKAYVNMILKTVQLENPDIKIVTYEPGVVDTQMQETIRKTDEKIFGQVGRFNEYFQKKQLHRPDEIAKDIWERFVESWEGIKFNEGYDQT